MTLALRKNIGHYDIYLIQTMVLPVHVSYKHILGFDIFIVIFEKE